MNKVVGVSFDITGQVARLQLDCGHTTDVDSGEEESLSFMGAETTCTDCSPALGIDTLNAEGVESQAERDLQ